MNTLAEPLMRLAARVDAIEPFYVMELMKEAQLLEGAGARHHSHGHRRTGFHRARTRASQAAADALRRGVTQYTNALGLALLREAIARHYRDDLRRSTWRRSASS